MTKSTGPSSIRSSKRGRSTRSSLDEILQPVSKRRRTFLDKLDDADRETAFQIRRAWHSHQTHNNSLADLYEKFRPPCSLTIWFRFCQDSDGTLYPEAAYGKAQKRR